MLRFFQIFQLPGRLRMFSLVAAQVFDDATLDEPQAILVNEIDRLNGKAPVMLAADLFLQRFHGFLQKTDGRFSRLWDGWKILSTMGRMEDSLEQGRTPALKPIRFRFSVFGFQIQPKTENFKPQTDRVFAG